MFLLIIFRDPESSSLGFHGALGVILVDSAVFLLADDGVLFLLFGQILFHVEQNTFGVQMVMAGIWIHLNSCVRHFRFGLLDR